MSRPDLRTLRQRAAELRAEGERLEAEMSRLAAADSRTEEQNARLAELQTSLREWEARAEVARDALESAEEAHRRAALLDGLVIRPGARIGSTEPDPAQTGGFRNLADFALSVQRASTPGHPHPVDHRLAALHAAPSNFHQERGSADGYMVPPAFREQIWELMLAEEGALLNMVDMEPTASNQVNLLRDETTPWGSSGVQAYWRAEGAQMTPSRLATEPSTVKLHELYAFVLATEELLEDAPRLNARLTRQAARAINWKASEAIMWGTGAGQPQGWMTAPCLVTVAKEPGQTAATVVAANVAKMYSRLMPSSLNRAFWLVNSDVLPQLILMTLGDQPIWTPPSTGLTGAPGGVLFGRPVIPNEHSQTVGTKGDIQLVDPLGYYMARKANGLTFAQSMHLYFDYAIQAFRWTFRLGGQPYLSAPVSPAKGSSTKSHFVCLETRS